MRKISKCFQIKTISLTSLSSNLHQSLRNRMRSHRQRQLPYSLPRTSISLRRINWMCPFQPLRSRASLWSMWITRWVYTIAKMCLWWIFKFKIRSLWNLVRSRAQSRAWRSRTARSKSSRESDDSLNEVSVHYYFKFSRCFVMENLFKNKIKIHNYWILLPSHFSLFKKAQF